MIIKSFSKINLTLSVVGKKEDGYHLLRMVDLPLDLHDSVEIERANSLIGSHVTCDDVGLSSLKENLCMKAYKLMKKTYGFEENFNIHIHKEIPFAAGLGGGSSNAAVVMMAIRDILKLPATNEELAALSVTLGADVPYFFTLKPALVEGIGEFVKEIPVKNNYYALVVKPLAGCSTKEIYESSDSFDKFNINVEGVVEGLGKGDDDLIAASMGNDLYPAATKQVPEIDVILDLLRKEGFKIVAMSGSGSSCFALSTDMWKIKNFAKKMERRNYIVKVAKVLK